MNVLLRVLGMHALAMALQRFSPRSARVLSFVVVAGSTAYPLWAVLAGRWGAGDVLVTFWLENLAVGFWVLVRALTATHAYDRPGAFSMGAGARDPFARRLSGRPAKLASTAVAAGLLALFTGIHGVLVYGLFGDLPRTGGVADYLRMLAILWAAHGIGTAVEWFGQGLRHNPDPSFIVGPAAQRLAVLHVTVLLAAVVTARLSADTGEVVLVLLLVAVKVGVDLWSHARAARESGQPSGHHVVEHAKGEAA